MTQRSDALEVESHRTFIVFDRTTGVIVHIHRITIHRGAEELTDEEAEARTLEIASRFGPTTGLAVLKVDGYDSSIPQCVDVKTRRLITVAD